MDIGELNRRITISEWTTTRDAGGGATVDVIATFDVWAKVEDRSGSTYTNHNTIDSIYDYKVTFRYDPNRIVNHSFTITYDSKEMKINSISYDNEAHKKFCIARCSVVRP